MVTVTISDGKLEGDVVNNEFGGQYFSFKGIPYAEPPLGDLRFKAPQSKKPWKGTRKAKEFGSRCCQLDTFTKSTLEGTEDCLYLNVYTPAINPSNLLPVMFWIHGGGLCCGSGDDDIYGPEFLIRHGVVLVTFNYRLEVLGFLCLDTEEIPGNAGMKDQVAALRWVKKNIVNFGGDPDNITIFGESAGGASVSFHLISPMSKGLFRRAITQSGCCTCWWAVSPYARERAIILAQELGCNFNNDKDMYEFFKSQPAESLINRRVSVTYAQETRSYIDIYFGIVSEKKFENNETFFQGDVYEALRAGIHEGVDVINGYTEDEGVFLLTASKDLNALVKHANKYVEYFVPRPIEFSCSGVQKLDIGKKLKKLYFGDKKVSKETLNELIRFCSMDMFVYGSLLWQKIIASNNSNKIYSYRFGCKSKRNILKDFFQLDNIFDRIVVAHADDLPYLFPMKIANQTIDVNSTEFKMIDQVCKLWTNFATFGDPTPDDSFGVRWPPFILKDEQYMDIGKELKLGAFAERDELAFWESIFSKFCPWLVVQSH